MFSFRLKLASTVGGGVYPMYPLRPAEECVTEGRQVHPPPPHAHTKQTPTTATCLQYAHQPKPMPTNAGQEG